MRITKHDVRAAIAQRPIVDFTEPAMRPTRRRQTRHSTILAAITSLLRNLS